MNLMRFAFDAPAVSELYIIKWNNKVMKSNISVYDAVIPLINTLISCVCPELGNPDFAMLLAQMMLCCKVDSLVIHLARLSVLSPKALIVLLIPLRLSWGQDCISTHAWFSPWGATFCPKHMRPHSQPARKGWKMGAGPHLHSPEPVGWLV